MLARLRRWVHGVRTFSDQDADSVWELTPAWEAEDGVDGRTANREASTEIEPSSRRQRRELPSN